MLDELGQVYVPKFSRGVDIFDDKIVYPDIENFFLELGEKKPKQNFSGLVQKLIGNDFFHIDELANWKEAAYH